MGDNYLIIDDARETRMVQYTPIWDLLCHSKQIIKEINTTSCGTLKKRTI
jgi:hypothetical protein